MRPADEITESRELTQLRRWPWLITQLSLVGGESVLLWIALGGLDPPRRSASAFGHDPSLLVALAGGWLLFLLLCCLLKRADACFLTLVAWPLFLPLAG